MKKILTLLVIVFGFTFGCFAQTDKHTESIEKIIDKQDINSEVIDSITNLDDLRLLRNSIYANHGYIFKNDTLLNFFKKFKWYHPTVQNVDRKLTSSDEYHIKAIQYQEMKVRISLLTKDAKSENILPLSETEKKMIGIWQDSPVMAAGWSESYAFYQNRKVIFRSNQMNGERRLLARIGNWKIENNKIQFEFFAKEILVGGKVESDPIMGECIKHATLKQIIISPVEIESYDISGISEDADFNLRLMLTIDGRVYWKFMDDPNDYE